MKILMINTLYSPNAVGGAEVSVQLLAEELVRRGNEVRVLTLSETKEKKIKKINGVDVIYLPLINIYWPFGCAKNKMLKLIWHFIDLYNPFMAMKVGKEIDIFKPDVVHTNNISGFSVSVWKKIKSKKVKLVHTTRDYYLFHPNSTMYGSSGNMSASSRTVRLWSFVKRRMSQYVDTYIGISEYITKFHLDDEFFENAESGYIYNAVDKINVISNQSKNLSVGFIGRLTNDKGFDVFCAIAEKHIKDKTIDFFAAGRFNHGEIELKNKANGSAISLLGFVPIKEFLEKVDIVILPVKWREPFGRVVAECAMAGKVVITNFVGGITEISKQLDNIYRLEDIDSILLARPKSVKINDAENPFKNEKIAEQYLRYYQ